MLALTTAASAYDGDWKRGRVYYQGVCTSCHKATSKPEGIAPNDYTIAEWTAYLAADKHAKGKDTLKQYVSQAYRARSRPRTRWRTDCRRARPGPAARRQGLRGQRRQGRRRAGELQLKPRCARHARCDMAGTAVYHD